MDPVTLLKSTGSNDYILCEVTTPDGPQTWSFERALVEARKTKIQQDLEHAQAAGVGFAIANIKDAWNVALTGLVKERALLEHPEWLPLRSNVQEKSRLDAILKDLPPKFRLKKVVKQGLADLQELRNYIEAQTDLRVTILDQMDVRGYQRFIEVWYGERSTAFKVDLRNFDPAVLTREITEYGKELVAGVVPDNGTLQSRAASEHSHSH